MTTYQWLCLFGVPAILAGLAKIIHSMFKKSKSNTDALKLGVQALLRAQMVNDYNKWTEKGYAPIYARENFENCWVQYEALGANGVMKDIHDKFLSLPTQPKE